MKRLSFVFFLFISIALADPPAKDSTVDWLMNQSTTAPSTQPLAATTQPAAAFNAPADDGSRTGVLTLSDGKTIHGNIATTAEKPVRVWVESIKDYQDIPFSLIKSIEASVLWERDEPEWHFKASGSDVKEFSGKTYPARETQYKLTLSNGQTIEGGIVAPLYVTVDGDTKTYILHKRDKGDPDQTLGQLVYVKSVTLGE